MRNRIVICLIDVILVATVNLWAVVVEASDDEDRLIAHILKNVNPLIRPVMNASSPPLIVSMTVQLVYIIKVIERNQIMHTNVWLTLQWKDFQMRWNPVHFGELKKVRVASDKVWLPDIVLFNNADGNYEVSFKPNVVIEYTGQMLWVPPAIYKSSCIIDVEFFPFDEQQCHMNFGSWTYNENEIKLDFVEGAYMDISEYRTSSSWDLIDAPASLVKNKSWIEYQIIIRRKTLFYTVMLIIPTVLMAFLSVVVFCLPTDSREKITLTIQLLLSIVVFLLLVSKILPPTSSTIPLMAKYLLLTFVLNVITILVTVVDINVYFRDPSTHSMPDWVRFIFLEFMPKMLCLKKPRSAFHKFVRETQNVQCRRKSSASRPHPVLQMNLHHPLCSTVGNNLDIKKNSSKPSDPVPAIELTHVNRINEALGERDPITTPFYPLTKEAIDAINAIEYITEYIKENEEQKMKREDWKYVGLVIDRFLLYIFVGITLGGTLGILLSAPHILETVDQKKIIDEIRHHYTRNDL
ncbi:unnamed protein product [Enterobius vermicularis]|uniref:Neur_chan_LBD domain-containing protein n=1 Tax=Enterobius vermicularis TaxID=51028 RepID=A0A0N4V1J4_ENTVE|nr:unnamed protein product [Enterobius vermicularis]